MNAPSSRNQEGDVDRPSADGPLRAGRAEARRATSAGLADLAERQVDAVAALDRALEPRLGELDRAFATRRTNLESRLSEAEGALAEAADAAVAEFRRAASDERRLLQEEAAAQLAELERAVGQHLRELEETAVTQLAPLRELIDRVDELEQAATARIRDLGRGPD